MKTNATLGLLFAASLGALMCDKPKPQPTPSPSPTATATPAPTPEPTATPTPEPTPTADICPPFDPAKLRLPCKLHSVRGDGWDLWDCTLKGNSGDYMPEGDPHALECQLKALGGRAQFVLIGQTGDLKLKLRDTNAFQFLLSGSGTGNVMCPANGFDPCRSQAVSR